MPANYHGGGWHSNFADVGTATGWAPGDVAWNMGAAVFGPAGSRYTVLGWRRLTSGSGNVLGTDWAEMRVLTGT